MAEYCGGQVRAAKTRKGGKCAVRVGKNKLPHLLALCSFQESP